MLFKKYQQLQLGSSVRLRRFDLWFGYTLGENTLSYEKCLIKDAKLLREQRKDKVIIRQLTDLAV